MRKLNEFNLIIDDNDVDLAQDDVDWVTSMMVTDFWDQACWWHL